MITTSVAAHSKKKKGDEDYELEAQAGIQLEEGMIEEH
jgi:hypothetical protein